MPGRPGTLTTLEGNDVYDTQVLSASCFMEDASRIPEIAAWLRGDGMVTFANRQGGYFKARIVNQISFEKILRGNPHRSFVVNFRCQPFFYLSSVADITVTASGTVVRNPGCVYAEPVLRVTLNADAEITVGGTFFTLTGVTGTVTIDTPLMETYKNYATQNSHMSGDYPRLLPGNNIISWTGGVTRIVITPNFRTL